jgi:OOP family OmpA-OmpF porin
VRYALLTTIAFSVSLLAGAAGAQEQLKSDDIVKHFANSADLGAKRGICIGTIEECNKDQPAPAGLDMLINFDLDSADLTEQARQSLNEFAKALKDNRLRAATFVVEGHTDARGEAVYNDKLSERRAQAVSAFLLANGVDASRVEAVGLGEQKPRVADIYDPVNRRVEMRIKVQ